jgi:hypothetical protein
MPDEPRIAIVDAHAHLFSLPLFEAVAAQLPGDPADPLEVIRARTGIEIPADTPSLADRWVREMDRHHVDRMVLIASVPGDEANALAAAARHPDRIVPYALFHPLADDAPARLHAALDDGLRGVCLFPAMHHYRVDDPHVLAWISVAAKFDAIVFVHFGLLRLGIRDKLGLQSPFDLRFSNPIDLCAAAQHFPATSFVIPHLGAGFFREALLLCKQCDNVHLDTSSSNSWIATQPGGLTLDDALAQALQVVGTERLLFGSDSNVFPRGFRRDVLDIQVAAFRDLGLSPDEEAAIFAGNLLRLLGIQD